MQLMKYAKGLTAAVGTVGALVLTYGELACGTYWPAIVAGLTAAGVVAVPNRRPEQPVEP